MKKHKKQSKNQAAEKLDMLMQELEAKIDSSSTVPGSCRRIYCI
jgi:hypothetical protein